MTPPRPSRSRPAAPPEDAPWYRRLFEDNPQPMWVYDRKTLKFLAVNDAALRQYGHTREEFLRMTIKDLRPPEDVPALLAQLNSLGDGLKAPDRWRHRRKDGTILEVEITSQSIEIDGHDARIVLAIDQTERAQSEDALRVSEERFRTLVEHSSDVILLLDAQGGIRYASQSAAPVLGYAAGENLGRNVFDLIHPDDSGTGRELLQELLARPGAAVRRDVRARHKDGSWRHLEVVAVNRLADPAVSAIVVNYRDVSERLQAERQLRQTLSLLEAALESTTDGILVVDQDGRVTSYNRKFAELWRIPDGLLESRDDARLIAYVLEQLAQPELFVAKIRDLYGRPEASSYDILLFTDGRVFERYSQPQLLGKVPAGRVWSFRDITERKRAERLQQATYRIADAAGTASSLQDLLASVHRIVGELMPAHNFYVALVDQAARMIEFPYFIDEADPSFDPKPWGKGLTEWVIRTGQALLATPEVYRDMERRGEVELIGAPSLDWVGVPLKIGEKTIGVLVVQTYTEGVRYGERERDILQFVSTQVARAIERTRTEEQLRQSETRYRLLFESNPEAMFVYDPETLRFLAVNEAAVTRYGWSRGEFLAMTLRDIARVDQAASLAESRHRKKDGTLIDVEVLSESIEFEGRRARLVLAKDVTERRRLEEQLRQSQKMEAVGQLAGGIAHDFNNLLTAILGFCGLLDRQVGANPRMREDLDEIRKAAGRAADLTRQLLAFSRRQMLAPRVLDLNALVAELDKMLRRIIGEHIELVARLDPGLAPVKADPGQLEQVILNLVVNARDAMAEGGRLTIQTANVDLDPAYVQDHAPVVPGRYVLLAVSDTGIGMTAEVKAHLFEPFFTTKEVGKGTGLGLATVYGIVKQSGGYIWVYSEVGQGATIKIYLPRTVQGTPAEPRTPTLKGLPTGTETVLIVEDAEAIRALTRKVLMGQGYQVMEAGDGIAALRLVQAHEGPLDLVLTDVVMPGMGGRELAQHLTTLRPGVRLLYMSGYTADTMVHRGVLEDGVPFLPKPFTPEDLARKVRDALDARS